MEISVPATLLLMILWVGWNSAGWSLLVAVLHVQAGISSSISPLHVASNPSVVQPGLPYWLGTGLQREKSGSFQPSCGLSSLRTSLLLRAQDDQPTRRAVVRPHPHKEQGGRTRGWRVWRLIGLALMGSLHSTWRWHALWHWGWREVERWQVERSQFFCSEGARALALEAPGGIGSESADKPLGPVICIALLWVSSAVLSAHLCFLEQEGSGACRVKWCEREWWLMSCRWIFTWRAFSLFFLQN